VQWNNVDVAFIHNFHYYICQGCVHNQNSVHYMYQKEGIDDQLCKTIKWRMSYTDNW
jgi:hypothetical protein